MSTSSPPGQFLKFQTLPAAVTALPFPSRAAARIRDEWLDLLNNLCDGIPTSKVFTTIFSKLLEVLYTLPITTAAL